MIRFCNINDKSEWIRLNREFMKQEVQDWKFWNDVDKTSNELFSKTYEKALENPEIIKLLIIEDDEGNAIGFANLMVLFSIWSHGKALELDDIYIIPEKRGKGIGKNVIKYIEDYASVNGYMRFQFKAEEHNARANKLYKALGYESEKMNFYAKYF